MLSPKKDSDISIKAEFGEGEGKVLLDYIAKGTKACKLKGQDYILRILQR